MSAHIGTVEVVIMFYVSMFSFAEQSCKLCRNSMASDS